MQEELLDNKIYNKTLVRPNDQRAKYAQFLILVILILGVFLGFEFNCGEIVAQLGETLLGQFDEIVCLLVRQWPPP